MTTQPPADSGREHMASTPEANPTQKLAKLQVALIDFGFADDEALEMARALKSSEGEA
ncbi:hypothetical protein UFOVP1623_4 [uncultured Caudovirales phage]|uniref:Uncharacterized protein n=1 Tax=uncultured Caudovirales phage TaxID=2100421 RepID=A0A6J5T026_9CAUD|nr:hypothetical protein UFOVP1376_5 [uncultured Caudovirales phage]CAB4220606.1 hypothetical protein UFOVP1623_4 [uncultured Caudovirales phage]